MKNTITIDGVTTELTEEQVEKLKVELGVKKKTSFDRVKENEFYHCIGADGEILDLFDIDNKVDNTLYKVANYCTDKDLLTKRAKEEVLNRLLWRFSMENDGDKIDWNNGRQNKYRVYYDHEDENYIIDYNSICDVLTVYFYTKEIAQRAIDEIIIPFNEGKLPCCEIWEE